MGTVTDGERGGVAHCCSELRDHDAQRCDQHRSPWDCPDFVVVRHRDGTYGLPIRDGQDAAARSSITIHYCPWCGSPLPGHATRPPTAADREAGRGWSGLLAGERPIVRAAEAGDVAEVRALLAAGVPALDRDEGGWTALHAAAVRGYPEVIRVLLATGADVDVLDEGSFTPLLNAAGEAEGPTVALLIEAGADVNYNEPTLGWTPLSRAAEHSNVEVLALLLEAGADPNAGEPLINAAEAGCLDCVERLLAAGADPAVRVDGETAAELGRIQGHDEIARLLERFEAQDTSP